MGETMLMDMMYKVAIAEQKAGRKIVATVFDVDRFIEEYRGHVNDVKVIIEANHYFIEEIAKLRDRVAELEGW